MQTFPVELIGDIVENSDTDLLPKIALASQRLQIESERVLYRHINIDDLPALQKVYHALSECPRRRVYVKSLILPLRKRPMDDQDYEARVRAILAMTPNLVRFETYHYVEPKTSIPVISIPLAGDSFNFLLTRLLVRYGADPYLTDFLVSQRELRELVVLDENDFEEVPATALPKLAYIHGPPHVVERLAPGRPLRRVVSRALDPITTINYEEMRPFMKALSQATGPITSLTLSLSDVHSWILEMIGDHLPHLISLRLHEVYTQYELIEERATDAGWLQGLRQMPSLQSLKWTMYVIPPPLGDAGTRILSDWKAACPSLKVVTLPDEVQWWYEAGKGWKEGMAEGEEPATPSECMDCPLCSPGDWCT